MIDWDGFWEYVCGRKGTIITIHGLTWLVLGLNTVSSLFVGTDPGTSVIIGMNYIGITPLLVLSGAILLKCRNSDR